MEAVKVDKRCADGDKQTDLDALLEQAIAETKNIEIGQEFVLRQLFIGYVWDCYETGVKLQLGRNFKEKVRTGKVDNVIYVGKADNNSAKYRKVQNMQ